MFGTVGIQSQTFASHIKAQCHNPLVRPILDYGSCVWDPQLVTQIQKLEKIHKRSARFLTGNHTFKHRNTKLNIGWYPLQERRPNQSILQNSKQPLLH